MVGSIVSRPARAGRTRLVALALVIVAAILIAGAIVFALNGGTIPSRADVHGPPVRAATPAGDRVMLLTRQWRTVRSRTRPTRLAHTRLYVDVWGFDAATGRPLWRRRIADEPSGGNSDRALLGVQGGALWLLDGKGILGLNPIDGAVIADAEAFAAANPSLKDLMPGEARYVRFDPRGLSFTAADGRDWRLTGQGARAAPDGPRLDLDAQRAPPAPGVFLPARIAGGNGSWAFYTRGLVIDRRWLGLAAEPEVAAFDKADTIGGVDPENHPRTRLWSASVGDKTTFFGARQTLDRFTPLPEGPEYLAAGLLQDGRCCHNTPIFLRDPDSVLVIHRERLGEAGRFRLTRATGPNGKPAWTVDLPITSLEAVMPGESDLVLLGARDEPPLFRYPNAQPESVDQLVTVNLATGATTAYRFRIPATPASRIPASTTQGPGPTAP